MRSPPLRLSHRPSCALLAATLAAALPACKKTVTPPAVQGLALLPPQSTRDLLMAEVALRSLDGSLARVEESAALLGLPVKAADLRTMLLARMDLPAQALEVLDLSRPVTLAVVAHDRGAASASGALDADPGPSSGDEPAARDEPNVAITFALRGGQDPGKALAALGEVVERQQDALHVRRVSRGGQDQPGGELDELWLLPRGEVLLAAPTLEALRAAGAHALAARAVAPETLGDLGVTLYPRAIARSLGQDLEEALARWKRELSDGAASQATAQGRDPEAARRGVEGVLGLFADWIAHTRAMELGALLEGKQGARLYARVHPRPGTPLQKQLAAGEAARLDPGLLGPGSPVSVGAIALSEGFLQTYLAMLDQVAAGQPDTDAFLSKVRAVLALVRPVYSYRWDVAGGRSQLTVSGKLREGTTGEAMLAALDAAFSARAFAAFLKAAAPDVQPRATWQRKGNEGRLKLDYPTSGKSPRARELAKVLTAMFGSPRLEVVTRVQGDRWWSASEPGAAQRLDLLAAGTAPEADPELRRILDETAGMEGFTHLDLLAALRMGIAVAAATEPSAAQLTGLLALVPGLDRHRVPLIVAYRGGDHLHAELRIPGRALEATGALIGPLRALGLGLGGSPGSVLTPQP